MKDLCERMAHLQSHSSHKLVGLEPFAPAALFFRIALTYAALRREGTAPWSLRAAAQAAALAALAWLLLFGAKLALGFLLKAAAVGYVGHYERKRAAGRGGQRRVTIASTTTLPSRKED